MLPRVAEWTRRALFPARGRAPLGFAAEYWLTDPNLYEAWLPLRERLLQLGRKPTRSYVSYYLSSHLINDVIIAAGGVEAAIVRLRTAKQELQATVLKYGIVPTPGNPQGLSDPAAVDAWYAFSDLLSWCRAVVERLDRRAGDSKKFPRQGLLHAIRPKLLKRRCEELTNELVRGPVGQSRLLANFLLHTTVLRNPFSGIEMDDTGSLILPIPDLPSALVRHWYLLTWHGNRDGFGFAEELWNAVQRAVDELLQAFEDSIPRRMRKKSTPHSTA